MTAAFTRSIGRDRAIRIIGVLLSRRRPIRIEVLAEAAEVSRATAYRYIADIRRLGAIPLVTTPDSSMAAAPGGWRARLVAIDWAKLRGRR